MPKDRLKWKPGGGDAEGKFAIAAATATRIALLVAITIIALHNGWTGDLVTWVARIRGP